MNRTMVRMMMMRREGNVNEDRRRITQKSEL